MTSNDIIKHIYTEHKRTKLPVEDVWEAMFANFGKQTINDMLKDSDSSWNNDENFETDSKFMQLGIVYVITFILIWVVFNYSVKNQFHALQYAIIASGFVSISITSVFMNMAGKNERQYLNAINKLRKAHAIYTNHGGFKDLVGKPLDYVKEDG
jgi:cytosine/uracil/thiamine/allantoin permease